MKGIVSLIDEILDENSIPVEVEEKLKKPSELNETRTSRKKKYNKLSINDRSKRDAKSHQVLPISCNCQHDFTEEERQKINKRFWCLTYNDQKVFIINSVRKSYVKRRRTDDIKVKRRSGNMQYFLTLECNEILVCQKLFLETLGYTSNQFLKTAAKGIGKIESINNKCGKAALKIRINGEVIQSIITDIKSYDPQISHYRRTHASNRLRSTYKLQHI